MREFFHGWKRKVGVVTLVMALILVGGWLRSENRFEGVAFPTERGPTVCLVSWDSSLVWLTEYAGNFGKYPEFRSRLLTGIDDRIFVSPHCKWRVKLYGFGVGDGVDVVIIGNRIERSSLTVVPYWSIVVPLTLLSAYLLLSKPRPATPMKTSEAVPTKAP